MFQHVSQLLQASAEIDSTSQDPFEPRFTDITMENARVGLVLLMAVMLV
jgi:hypothetical protein